MAQLLTTRLTMQRWISSTTTARTPAEPAGDVAATGQALPASLAGEDLLQRATRADRRYSARWHPAGRFRQPIRSAHGGSFGGGGGDHAVESPLRLNRDIWR